MKNRKPLLIAGTVAVALLGVSVISVVALSNNGKLKQIAPHDTDHPFDSEVI